MEKPRLNALADGIFAIVMTLLVIEFKVPEFHGLVSDSQLLSALIALNPLLMSYVLSFSVLATYWIAHHFIMSVFAKNIDKPLMYMNIPFFMAVAFIPFSSHLLGTYYYSQVAVVLYALNVVLIGVLLLTIFRYISRSRNIKNPRFIPKKSFHFTYIRILIPPVCGVFAIAVSFLSPILAINFLVFPVIFNLIPGVVHAVDDFIISLQARR